MNIREHIEAGHYPTDDKGRALVPGSDGGTWTILATDVPCTQTIAACDQHGNLKPFHGTKPDINRVRLLPPPPRKVKVTRWCWVEIKPRTGITECFDSKADAERHRSRFVNPETWRLVELTGEYEEPWQP